MDSKMGREICNTAKAKEIKHSVLAGVQFRNNNYHIKLDQMGKPIIVSNHTGVANVIFDWENLTGYPWKVM
jgi:hypothetical protein